MLSTLTRRRGFPFRRRWPRAFVGGEILPVTFPATQLQARVYIALGADLSASWLTWNWLDITARVAVDRGIDIEAGRRNEATKVNPAICQLRILNDDGYLSRLNPLSPYYGLIALNTPVPAHPLLTRTTPIWIQIDPGSGYFTLYQGYMNELPISWPDETGEHAHLLVECSGVLRRLSQGFAVESPLHRVILADTPTHYWRLDDPEGSAAAASSLPGGGTALPLTFGTVGWREQESPPGGDGASSAATMNDGLLSIVPDIPAPWAFEYGIERPADDSLAGVNVAFFRYFVDGVLDGRSITVTDDGSGLDWYHYMLTGVQDGANYTITLWKNGVSSVVDSGVGTLGVLRGLDFGAGGVAVGAEFGMAYAAVYSHADADATVHSDALQAFAGERAHVRLGRLCGYFGIPFVTQAAESEPMGPQPSGNLIDLMRECETTDQGVLWEDGFGLRYQALSERYNQPVGLELDFGQRHIFGTPVAADDDQRLRNQWTIRSSSTSAERTANDPASITIEGLRDDSDSINSAEDGQLVDHAGWRVRLGTVDEYRWTTLAINLGGTPDLIPAWSTVPLGVRMTVANPPSQAGPGPLDVIVEGFRQRVDSVSWVAHLNTAPASPYQVGVAGDSTTPGSWAQTVLSLLAEDVDEVETDIDVTSFDDWTNADPGGEELLLGGEVLALDAVAGTAPNWTFTVRRSMNGIVKSHSSGQPLQVRRPLVACL